MSLLALQNKNIEVS